MLGRQDRVTDPLGGVTRYTYDDVGNLASLTDAENHTRTFEYDDLDRLEVERDAETFGGPTATTTPGVSRRSPTATCW